MDNPEKAVDLAPHEWSSSDNREKPKEPVFQPGGLLTLFAIVGAIIGATLIKEYGYAGTATGAVLGVVIGAISSTIINAARG